MQNMNFSFLQCLDRYVSIKRKNGFKILLTFIWLYLTYSYLVKYIQNTERKYIRKIVDNAKSRWRPACGKNRFSLLGMDYCSPKLTCKEIYNDVKKGTFLDRGTIKQVYLAYWNGYTVVWNEIKKGFFNTDVLLLQRSETFLHGAQTLDDLQSTYNFVTQIIGKCDSIMITEHYPLGSIEYLELVMEAAYGNDQRSAAMRRMQLCIDYVEIIDFLHSWNPNKTYVMCDTYSLELTLQQFLLTDKLRLVLNDVDYIVVIDNLRKKKITCGKREEQFDLMAPEMLKPSQNKPWTIGNNFYYDEKVEIWKIPNMCNYFLGEENRMMMRQLSEINSRCKNIDPRKRPSAREVLHVYKNMQF